ncbi:MAG: GNAT family N-acetyltransferase [Pseudomonadota bacterium]
MTIIRPLAADDFEAWHVLWRGYNDFYRADVPDDVSRRNFTRLVEQRDGLMGLLALDTNGTPIGLAHLVFHPSTWVDGVYCYLEDLFVDRSARGTGAAKALIEEIYRIADERGDVGRVYWTTQEFNAPARSLYDQVAKRTSFIRYQRS